MRNQEELKHIAGQFRIRGKLLEVVPYKSGHINETYLSTWSQKDGGSTRFIHQWVNNTVFKDVPALMRNVEQVTRHIAQKIGKSSSADKVLTIIPAQTGAIYYQDQSGEYWRTYEFIENTESFGVCTGLGGGR